MRTSIQILPGILFIGWVECSKLPDRVACRKITGEMVAVLTTVHPVDFFDDPECSCLSTKKNGGWSEKATLKFHSHGLIPYTQGIGFVVTSQNGSSYLIGSKEHPLPIIDVDMKHGSPDGDGGGFYYEVTHTALRTMIPCII